MPQSHLIPTTILILSAAFHWHAPSCTAASMARLASPILGLGALFGSEGALSPLQGRLGGTTRASWHGYTARRAAWSKIARRRGAAKAIMPGAPA